MRACRLRIEIPGETADADAWVRPGGVVDVVIHVDVQEEVTCQSLKLERFWRTSGRGDRDTGTKRSIEVFSGTWAPGHYAYPAQISVGRKVATYHGKHIQVDWHLRARASVLLQPESKSKRKVLVVPGPAPAYEAPPAPVRKPVKVTGDLDGCFKPSLGALATIAGFLTLNFPILAAILGGLTFALAIKSYQARRRTQGVGLVSFGAWPERLVPGADVQTFVEIAPELDQTIERVRVVLIAKEFAVSGSGSDRETFTHKAARIVGEIGTNLSVRTEEPFRGEATLQIPENAPTTLNATSNRIEWTLRLEILLPGDRVLDYERTIEVRGGSRIAPAGASSSIPAP